MSNEDFSIIEEINEELKNDKQLEFLKRHKNTILIIVVVSLIGIVSYLSWYERKKKNMENVTNALLSIVQNPTSKSNLTIDKIIEDAPVELRPILLIMKSGKELIIGNFSEANIEPLLDLSQKPGVDLVWRDLALLIYASYPTKPSAELIKLIEPLTQDNRPFRFTALEIIGMINKNEGKNEEALNCFEKILKNKEAPKTLNERITILSNYIKQNTENS